MILVTPMARRIAVLDFYLEQFDSILRNSLTKERQLTFGGLVGGGKSRQSQSFALRRVCRWLCRFWIPEWPVVCCVRAAERPVH